MKANELMIWDWIVIDGEVDYVRRNNIYPILCGEHDLEPIPLTEDILEANGFVADEKEAYLYRCGVYLLDIYYRIGEIEIYEDKGHYTSGYVCKHIKVDSFKYVHELQHALRLCGLNELADNFKIV